jgi:hypothetical protein
MMNCTDDPLVPAPLNEPFVAAARRLDPTCVDVVLVRQNKHEFTDGCVMFCSFVRLFVLLSYVSMSFDFSWFLEMIRQCNSWIVSTIAEQSKLFGQKF